MPTAIKTLQEVARSPQFARRIRETTGSPLRGSALDTVQANIGLKCNLACRHCHVASSPQREESMTWKTMEAVLRAAEFAGAHTLDITGGAPEMHPRFLDFVDAAMDRGLQVMVRTNLTILLEPGYEGMACALADRSVHLVASLPCYLPNNVDRQRGRHVYRDSIAAIQRLNALGYGVHQDKPLDLVYNPGGPALPPAQAALERAYREALGDEFGIRFNRLYTITNMPIGRFLRDLAHSGGADHYFALLRNSFNPNTVRGLMCRHQLHVGWDGTLYDCDFNFALGLPAAGGLHVAEIDTDSFRTRPIATGDHCFACTAGCGSSCGGVIG